MSLGCGPCNLCCKLLAVPDINKPARMLCWNTGLHGGCSRQAEKPSLGEVVYDEENKTFTFINIEKAKDKDLALLSCAQFSCLWLDSQKQDDVNLRQPRHARPDQTHVVIGPQDRNDRDLIYVQVDPTHPKAWQEPLIFNYLQDIISRGGKVEIIIDEIRFRLDEEEVA